jgi:hypothetical protein
MSLEVAYANIWNEGKDRSPYMKCRYVVIQQTGIPFLSLTSVYNVPFSLRPAN